MATVKGVVKKSSGKEFAGRNGNVMLYSFQIEGDARYFRTGTTAPPIAQGQTISFEPVQKGNNWTVEVSTIQQVAAADVQQAPPPTAGGGSNGTGGGSYNPQRDFENKDNYWARKEAGDVVREARINFSASQRDAIALVTAALEQDCLSFGNVAKGKKLDMLLDFVDQVTVRFVKQRKEAAGDE